MALILQMSRDIVDVIDKIEGEMRIEKYPNYWQPLLNTYDSSSISFSELYKYMIVDTDQLNIKYNFSDENCQKFAKIVFDKIARNKTWNYVTFLQKSRGKNRAKGFEWSGMIRYEFCALHVHCSVSTTHYRLNFRSGSNYLVLHLPMIS